MSAYSSAALGMYCAMRRTDYCFSVSIYPYVNAIYLHSPSINMYRNPYIGFWHDWRRTRTLLELEVHAVKNRPNWGRSGFRRIFVDFLKHSNLGDLVRDHLHLHNARHFGNFGDNSVRGHKFQGSRSVRTKCWQRNITTTHHNWATQFDYRQ